MAKLDSEGTWLWAKQAGGTGFIGDQAGSLAVDAFEAVYITGTFAETGTFGSLPPLETPSAVDTDIFVAKLDSEGTWLWAKQAGGRSVRFLYESGEAVALDAFGSVYITGNFVDRATFGSLPVLESTGGEDAFVAKLNSDGTWLWARRAGGTRDEDYGSSLAVDAFGSVYVTGSFSGTGIFGSLPPLESIGNDDIFVAKLDLRGEWIWAQRAGNSHFDESYSLALDSFGAVSVSGGFNSTIVFGNKRLGTEGELGNSSGFVAKLDAATGRWLDYSPPNVSEIGQAVTPPSGAAALEPDYEPDEARQAFFWSPFEKKLYAIRPGTYLLKWKQAENPNNDVRLWGRSTNVWPASPQIHVASSPSVAIEPNDSFTFFDMPFTTNRAIDSGKKFQADQTGYSVLRYVRGRSNIAEGPVVFDVVLTVQWDDSQHLIDAQPCTIGKPLTSTDHNDPEDKNGYVYFLNARYDPDVYNRATRTGPIFPVNKDSDALEDDMVVVWYETNDKGVAWPYKPMRYGCQWPTDDAKIIIANQRGSGALDPATYTNLHLYNQPDPQLPGYNPNEEHALILPPQGEDGSQALFALRSDLNRPVTSEPYTLLKYQNPTTAAWEFKVYQVVSEAPPEALFRYTGTAGTLIQPPYPLSVFLPVCADSSGVSGPYWEDYKGFLWAKAAGVGDTPTAEVVTRYFYRMQDGFYDDLNKDGVGGDAAVGDCIPWLDHLPGGTPGTPVDVDYTISWPEAPALRVGETLIKPKRGLPDILNQAAAEVIFDQSETDPAATLPLESLARLIDPLSPRTASLTQLPSDIQRRATGAIEVLEDLPPHLRLRMEYRPLDRQLIFKGDLNEDNVGDPLLLPNVMTSPERDELLSLSSDNAYQTAVRALYHLSRNPNNLDLDGDEQPDDALLVGLTVSDSGQVIPERFLGGPKALTAGTSVNTGYVTLAFNNHVDLDPLPVSLAVIRVDCPVYAGQLFVIPSDNLFDERLTLRHSGDFAGASDGLTFEWRYTPDVSGNAPSGPFEGWLDFATAPPGGQGAVDITIEGPGLLTLSDNWFVARYRGYERACPGGQPSEWAGAPRGEGEEPSSQLAPGWIKRAVEGLNPFEARVKAFHQAETNTVVSMIQQAGPRYEGAIAFNGDPENLNQVGLIEAYTTILNRGLKLSVDGTPPVDFPPANVALLNAASRISDLYMLLGNEAFADASNPNIGFGVEGTTFTLTPSIFAFQNQLSSLLEEELVLLVSFPRARLTSHI